MGGITILLYTTSKSHKCTSTWSLWREAPYLDPRGVFPAKRLAYSNKINEHINSKTTKTQSLIEDDTVEATLKKT